MQAKYTAEDFTKYLDEIHGTIKCIPLASGYELMPYLGSCFSGDRPVSYMMQNEYKSDKEAAEIVINSASAYIRKLYESKFSANADKDGADPVFSRNAALWIDSSASCRTWEEYYPEKLYFLHLPCSSTSNSGVPYLRPYSLCVSQKCEDMQFAALSISGFDLSTFMFFGFFPRENAERRKLLEKMRRGDTRTYAFYESPKRIMDLVEFFIDEDACCRMCLCNDLTKVHEMTFRGSPEEVRDLLLEKGNYDKGEYVALIEIDDEYVFNKKEHTVSAEAMIVDKMVSGEISLKEAVSAVLEDPNNSYSKNELKSAAINLKNIVG